MAQANAFMANNATPKKPATQAQPSMGAARSAAFQGMNNTNQAIIQAQKPQTYNTTPPPNTNGVWNTPQVKSVMTNDQAIAEARRQAQSPQYVGPNAASLTAKARAQGLTPVEPTPRTPAFPTTPTPATNVQPGTWNPSFSRDPNLQQPGQPIPTTPGTGAGMGNFYGAQDLWNLNPADESQANELNRNLAARLPAAQLAQNQYQYANDYNEGQRRWDTEMRWNKARDQFGMDLSGRQQQMTEWQANEAARQWAEQFGQQQANDTFTQGLSTRQQAQLENYQGGIIRNQANEITANRDVGMDANAANRYAADTRMNADKYGADQGRIAQMYGADRNVDVAGIYGGAQRYGADAELRGQMYGADRNLDVAGVYGAAQRYGSDNELQGKRYDMQGQMYGADRSLDSANVYGSAQRYAADQDAQAARYAAAMNAYGRAQAPRTGWATNWA